jgi:hypothetical protein
METLKKTGMRSELGVAATHAGLTFAYVYLGLARTIYIRCAYGIFGREIIIAFIYGHIQCIYTVLANPMYISSANALKHRVHIILWSIHNYYVIKIRVHIILLLNPNA